MKIYLLLTVTVLAGLAAAAADSSVFKPTWSGDQHDPPVYTSPTNYSAPATGHFTNLIALPAITNWPATNRPHPHMTNWPATNKPALTNPPAPPAPGQ